MSGDVVPLPVPAETVGPHPLPAMLRDLAEKAPLCSATSGPVTLRAMRFGGQSFSNQGCQAQLINQR